MSLTFTLTGKSSTLSTNFFPPIELDGEWEIGLLNFEAYNTIPNLMKGEVWSKLDVTKDLENLKILKKFVGKAVGPDAGTVFEHQYVLFPVGSYEIEDIVKYINTAMKHDVLAVKVNLNTLRATVITDGVDLRINGEICELLGFNPTSIAPDSSQKLSITFPKNTKRQAEGMPRITKVNIVRILCNLAQGSYINEKPTHSLHEFHPHVAIGYKISEVPSHVIYFPINRDTIETLTLNVVDQSGNLVDFRGEEVTIRVHLRKIS